MKRDMVKIHSIIKFWARKSPTIISELIPAGTKSLLDPFCGSGVSGYVGVLKDVRKILLSDVNPVAIFITHTVLDKTILDEKIYRKVKKICTDIANKAYSFTFDGKKFVIDKVAWNTIYICPYCGEVVDSRKYRKTRTGFLVCQRCNKKFLPINAKGFFEEPFEIHAYNEDGEKKIVRDPKLLKTYAEESKKFKALSWFPDSGFTYSNDKPFIQHPHRIKKVSELFTERGLFAASALYRYIENTWLEDPRQGDLLKLAFISSIASATKMLPYSKTSGTSWKLPRYWIPHVRYEKNFCNTYLRKLDTLYTFKRKWHNYIKSYSINVTYDSSNLYNLDDFSVNIVRSDARELDVNTKFDLIIMDPPHYAEINYYELTYLWQLWLKGRYNDRRFNDFNYWTREIDVNPRLGRNLSCYMNEMARVVSRYTNLLSRDGRLVLILHSSSKRVLNETIRQVKKYVSSLQYREIVAKIPSSAQGIHGKRKQKLYLLIY
ncbi:MAG: hypothetical protein G5Z42_02020 [Caldisphaeraceae archaeon]|nr:hypothetical protein [Caldisphaeraceae archaeon]